MHAYADRILQFLCGQTCSTNACSASPAVVARGFTEQTEASLSINLEGRTQPYLMDPSGLTTGIEPVSGGVRETIPNSLVNVAHDSAGVQVLDAQDGEYALQFTTVPGDVVGVELGFVGENSPESVEFQAVCHEEPCWILFALHRANSPALTVIPTIDPVGGLASVRVGELLGVPDQ